MAAVGYLPSMSGADIQALREAMQGLDTQLESINKELDRINKNMDELSRRQYVLLLTRTMSLMRMLGLPREASAALQIMQRLTIGAYHLYLNIKLLYAASGPLGWIFALTGIVMGAATIADAVAMGEDVY